MQILCFLIRENFAEESHILKQQQQNLSVFQREEQHAGQIETSFHTEVVAKGIQMTE